MTASAFSIIRTILLGLGIATLCGCRHEPSIAERQLEILRETESLYRSYLVGDVEQARRSLEKADELVRSATLLEPRGRDVHLILIHCRLYALAMRTGNTATAETEMVKIRYWLLSSMEMDGVSPEHALEKLRAYNAEKIVEYADQIDRKNNNNRLPKYVSGLKESRIESAK